MELHLKIAGSILILLALIHIPFPQYFKWKHELQGLTLINRQMMYVHAFFIAFTVLLMGVLSVFLSAELIGTELGRIISLGLAVFWMVRLFFQLFVYSSELWKGKKFETGMHVLFTGLWVYLSWVYILVWCT